LSNEQLTDLQQQTEQLVKDIKRMRRTRIIRIILAAIAGGIFGSLLRLLLF